MELKYEIMLILLTGLVAFATGMKKAKSSCCCCSLAWERDDGNQLQGVKVVKRQRSSVVPSPTPPSPPRMTRNPLFNFLN
tara:strand:- start:1125 stop:1364 length:240 start_codon:yes stop_codon:yes gene_type:complete